MFNLFSGIGPISAGADNARPTQAVMIEAKLPPMSFHKLRHTAATLMLASGTSVHQVRDMLGHSQIALTSNTYGHAAPAGLRAAAESLGRALRPEVKEPEP